MELNTIQIEYGLQDRTEWGSGEWDIEPDKLCWIDNYTGYICLIVRNHMELGSWCGYVGLNNEHPFYRTHHHLIDLDVYNGLSYSGFSRGQIGCENIKTQKPLWWIGFATCGCFDIQPALVNSMNDLYEQFIPNCFMYRDMEFMISEVTNLATLLVSPKLHGFPPKLIIPNLCIDDLES